MGKASGTGGRSAKGVNGSASATSTSGEKLEVGKLTESQYAELQDLYKGLDDEDLAEFNGQAGKRMEGIDLKSLDEQMRAELDKYGVHYDKASIDIWAETGPRISWRFFDKDNNRVGLMFRSFQKDERHNIRTMTNELFTLDESLQHGGVAKHLLAVQLDMARKAGIDTIAVSANIDVGGYTWARMGFQPDRRSLSGLMDTLGAKARGRSQGEWRDKDNNSSYRYFTDAEKKRGMEAWKELAQIYNNGGGAYRYRIAHVVEKYRDVIKPAWLGESWSGSINLRDRRNYLDYYNYLHSGKVDGIAEG